MLPTEAVRDPTGAPWVLAVSGGRAERRAVALGLPDADGAEGLVLLVERATRGAIYLQDEIEIGKPLTATLGLRYDFERYDFPPSGGFARREQFSTLTALAGVRLGRR